MNAVSAAFWSSGRSVSAIRAKGAQIGMTNMVVLIRGSFDEGPVRGFESYATLLFINRPAQEACRRAGVALNIVSELDEEGLPDPIGRLVQLPLYFEKPSTIT